jgi:peptidylamidoglycolate lyase
MVQTEIEKGSSTMYNRQLLSRRSLFHGTSATVAAVSLGALANPAITLGLQSGQKANEGGEIEILGQAPFRYRVNRHWGLLDRAHYPVKDCHGITEDRTGRIVLLTNDTRNNLLAYEKSGKLLQSWEKRFPGAHGFDIENHHGEDRYWITDHDVQCVSVCAPDGHELHRTGPEALATKYPDLTKYHPTNSALMADGDFYISDGYGSSFVHHMDPDGRLISSFGGTGDAPTNLNTPHAVWIDNRSGKPSLLVCDRGNEMLKWFSLSGELQQVVPVPGAQPSNVAPFAGLQNPQFKNHIAIASLNGMILILDGNNRVVSAVGGEPPQYADGKLQPLQVFNYAINHPHDVYVDSTGAIYVAQWWSNQTYPIKLTLIG